MFKTSEYLEFRDLTIKVMELEQLNRKIDIQKLSKISSVSNEVIQEFIASNNIENDIISFDIAKKFLRKDENISKGDLEKRWIGIKYASYVIWKDSFITNIKYINEAHRALMSKTSIVGGIFKQKLNQVGSLVTSYPDDVPKEMFNLLSTFIPEYLTQSSIYQIVPFISEFLAIHPYEDGNGRMSRLLMNKLFYDAGFKFVKYISISKYLWLNRKEYISALESRNETWARKQLAPRNLLPFFHIIIDSLIDGAKRALEYLSLKRYSKEEFAKVLKSYLVKDASFSSIMKLLKPSNSNNSIKKWIKEMVDNKEIIKCGSLRTTTYKLK